jgi:hypothetical protein
VIIIKANPCRVGEVALTRVSPVENAIKAAPWTTTARSALEDQRLVPLFRADSAFYAWEMGSRLSLKQIQVKSRILLSRWVKRALGLGPQCGYVGLLFVVEEGEVSNLGCRKIVN